MAAMNGQLGDVIKTKAIEQTMTPLIEQVNALVKLKERLTLTDKSEKQLKAVMGVGENLYNAIDKFVALGIQIGRENGSIREEMGDACRLVIAAGEAIRDITSYRTIECNGATVGIVKPSKALLSAVSRVLSLADRITILQILSQIDQVQADLVKIERIPSFSDFIKSFSDFGQGMVQLARTSGDRQAELLHDNEKNQVAFIRSTLEKLTGLLLTACKVALRHPDDDFAIEMKAQTFTMIREALNTLSTVLSGQKPSLSHSESGSNAVFLLQQIMELLEMSRMLVSDPTISEKLTVTFDLLEEVSHDFTDSAYIEPESREDLMVITERCRHQLNHMVRLSLAADVPSPSANAEYEKVLTKCLSDVKIFKKQLEGVAFNSGLFAELRVHRTMLEAIQAGAFDGDEDVVSERCIQFHEIADQVLEVCKMLEHVTPEEPMRVRVRSLSTFLASLRPNVSLAARILSRFPTSKISLDHFTAVCECWCVSVRDVSALYTRLSWTRGRQNSSSTSASLESWPSTASATDTKYMSLPRPGGYYYKHGSTAKTIKSASLDSEEKAKIAELGSEMKAAAAAIEVEARKWGDKSSNALVVRAKNMSDMAFSMYLFTRGEGGLASTQDLFTQARYFGEEGSRIFLLVRDFSSRVPNDEYKVNLLGSLERIPALCRQLLILLKRPTSGRLAVFDKVDAVLQQVKGLVGAVVKVVACSFTCFSKHNVEFGHNLPLNPTVQMQPNLQHSPRWDLGRYGATSPPPTGVGSTQLYHRRTSSLTSPNELVR